MIEMEYDFSTQFKCQVDFFNEDCDVQFIVNFDWNFSNWNREGELDIEVFKNDSYKIIDNIKLNYEPTIIDLNEMVGYIQDHILEDPNDFGFESFIEDERDFQNNQLFY